MNHLPRKSYFPDIVQIQISTNYGPRQLGWVTIGKLFLHVFILEKISKNLLQIQQAKLNRVWYKPFLHEGNSSSFK
jgi:hypothetical protein